MLTLAAVFVSGSAFPPQVVGRLHPLLVHLPIGIVALAALDEMIAAARRRQRTLPDWTLAAALVATAVSLLTGLVLAREEAPEDLPPVHTHRNAAFAMSALLAAAAAVRWKMRSAAGAALYRILLVFALAGLVLAAHLGAALVHGEDYLFPEP